MTARTVRSREQLRKHYEVERELAQRLRRAGPDERRQMYTAVYDELYRRVTDHPRHSNTVSPERRREQVATHVASLTRLMPAGGAFLEIGPGDCKLAVAMAAVADHVYAVDVAQEVGQAVAWPANFSFVVSDGCSVPVPPGSVQLAFSHQVMEHIHPEDALEQLSNIYAALAPGGRYLCVTPSRLTGPHDISRHFTLVADGLHLKEYTVGELAGIFRKAGFRRMRTMVQAGGRGLILPTWPARAAEALIELLPRGWRRRAALLPGVRSLMGVRLIAEK